MINNNNQTAKGRGQKSKVDIVGILYNTDA